jgi:CRP/FNR family transcriptional regulator, cyclic AMP receptor protein
MTPRADMASKNADLFDLEAFLPAAGMGGTVVKCRRKSVVFSQGGVAGAVYYVQRGRVKLAVVSERGNEAVVRLPSAGEFFGEGCLAGQAVRTETASAMTDCSLLRIEKQAMVRALHEQQELSDFFVAYLLLRSIRYQEDLLDQLFNSSEKRLARILLMLAKSGGEDRPQKIAPKISQETLAQMVGTTRSRVSFFMNKFKRLGLVGYNGGLEVRRSLRKVVLHGNPPPSRSVSPENTDSLPRKSQGSRQGHAVKRALTVASQNVFSSSC